MMNGDKLKSDLENGATAPFLSHPTTVGANNIQVKKGPRSWRHIWTQSSAILASDMAAMSIGFCLGFSGVLLPKLEADPAVSPSNEDETGWIASMAALSSPFGCLLGVPATEKLGRRMTLLVVVIPFLAGWTMIAAAPNLATLLAGRFITGLGIGLSTAAMQVYLSEIVEVRKRGMVGATPTLMLSLGTLVVYSLGTLWPWRWVSAFAAILPVFLLVGMYFAPESPSWLLVKGRFREAELALRRVRPPGHDVAEELRAIGSGGNTCDVPAADVSWRDKVRDKMRDFKEPEVWKPSLIMAVVFFTQQFCGGLVILFYSAQIFAAMPGGPDMYEATIMAGAARFAFTLAATVLLRMVGVRPLLLTSGVGMAASMLATATYGYLDELNGQDLPLRWLPAAGMVSFVVFFTPGFGTVSWVLLGELFPLRMRGALSCLLSCTCHVFVFVAVRTFPLLKATMGSHGAFFFYAAVSLAGTIFVCFALPETRGVSLADIEEHFRTGRFWMMPCRACAGKRSVGGHLAGNQEVDELISEQLKVPVIAPPSKKSAPV